MGLLSLVLAPPACASASIPKDEFVRMMRALVDLGSLSKADDVGRILRTTLRAEHPINRHNNGCHTSPDNKDSDTYSRVTTYSPHGDFWFRSNSLDFGNSDNNEKQEKTGNLDFMYMVTEEVECSAPSGEAKRVNVRILFNNLPAFNCVTKDDVQELLPDVEFETATDGVSLYVYQVDPKDEPEVRAEFVYYWDDQCASSVNLWQDSRFINQNVPVRSQLGFSLNLSGQEQLKLNTSYGIKIDKVFPWSAAARAGLLSGDYILMINNVPVENRILRSVLRDLQGQDMKLLIVRNGTNIIITIRSSEVVH
ncbi:MAG TPA: PDZ domain-containing protein [Stellaceae bacterium]|nr:PDZ domain-containing protein [Stellaceae bacterium]